MVAAVFGKTRIDDYHDDPSDNTSSSSKLILECLVQKLLHTIFLTSSLNDERSEAHDAYDATQILCLNLVHVCLSAG